MGAIQRPRVQTAAVRKASVQRFDAEQALDLPDVSSRVFGTLAISVPPLVEPPGSINASIALICEARAGCEHLLLR